MNRTTFSLCAGISIAALSLSAPAGADTPNSLKGKKVAILATDGFEKSELLKPREALKEAGAETVIVSMKSGSIKAWEHDHWAESVPVDKDVNGASAADFDALVLPGGVMSPDKLRTDTKAIEFVRGFVTSGKPIAAICHGPWTLIDAGAIRGKQVTSWPSLRTDIKNAGGSWVDQEVVVDGNLVTSRKPEDLPAFNREMIRAFGQGA